MKPILKQILLCLGIFRDMVSYIHNIYYITRYNPLSDQFFLMKRISKYYQDQELTGFSYFRCLY